MGDRTATEKIAEEIWVVALLPLPAIQAFFELRSLNALLILHQQDWVFLVGLSSGYETKTLNWNLGMRIQTMGSQGEEDNSGKQLEVQMSTQQNSMYGLTLDEVQNQLGDLAKPVSSMDLDELLRNVWTVDTNQSVGMEIDAMPLACQTGVHSQGSVPVTGALSEMTVDEVWRDIEQSESNEERKRSLGAMTLEDFLVKAGVVDEKLPGPIMEIDPSAAGPQFSQQSQWMQYAQPHYQHPQQARMGVCMPAQPIRSVMDIPVPDSLMGLPFPMMGGASSDTTLRSKRGSSEGVMETSAERRQKRMIKNRESAARSRARKQAYMDELENKVSRLEEENEMLRKRKEVEEMLASMVGEEPRYQLRRTSSAPL